jgi:hypothetical protein
MCAAQAITAAFLIGGLTSAAFAADDANELAKKLANPISSLISVPFQFNVDFGGGQNGDGDSYLLKFQPVIPFRLNDDWNVISRTIVPITYSQDIFANDFPGIADTSQSFFFSPSKPVPGGLIWGLGPIFSLPTATDPRLGSSVWGAGVTGVALVQKGPWTVGALASQTWSVEGNSINQTFLQPFLSYAFGQGQSVTLNSESTYDWTAQQWSVPINLTYQQVVKFGTQPVSLQIGGRYYAESPAGGPVWGIRAGLTYLFPTGK